MTDDDISVESVEVLLLSEIGMSSATMMKDAYPPVSGDPYLEEGDAGPNARVFVTKTSNQTPDEEIEFLLGEDPDDPPATTATHDFYTMILTMSMRLGDPPTTRFINGTIDVAFPYEIKILDYSPKDKSSITALMEKCGGTISISPGLFFLVPESRNTKTPVDRKENRFRIPVGYGEKITGTYDKKTGYSLDIPGFFLLEYQGMLKNTHDVSWEIYPPMPPRDSVLTGEKMLAVFSLIVQTPKNVPPELKVGIECRVKGNLWGMIPIRGSTDF